MRRAIRHPQIPSMRISITTEYPIASMGSIKKLSYYPSKQAHLM